jgi:drug/metabolite transporter (DMT)-like permease
MAVALLVLGERVAWHNALGGLVVIAGVGIVASVGEPRTASRDGGSAGVRWGIYTGGTIAAYTLWDGYAVTSLGLDPVVFFAFYAAWQSITLAPMLRDPTRRAEARRIGSRHLKEIALIAVLSPLGYILVLVAMQAAPIALVAPARESSIVVGTLMAWWLFKEPRLAAKLAGSVVVIAGIALLSV